MIRSPLLTAGLLLVALFFSSALKAQTPTAGKQINPEALRRIFDGIYQVLHVMDGQTDDSPTEVADSSLPNMATPTTEDSLMLERHLRYVRSHADCQFRISPEGKFWMIFSVKDSSRQMLQLTRPTLGLWNEGSPVDTSFANQLLPSRSWSTKLLNGTYEATSSFTWKNTLPNEIPGIDSVRVGFDFRDRSFRKFLTVTEADIGDTITIDTFSLQLIDFKPGYALLSVPGGVRTDPLLVKAEDDEGKSYRLTEQQTSVSPPGLSTFSRQYPAYMVTPFLKTPSLTADQYFNIVEPEVTRRMAENGKSDTDTMSYYFVRFVGPVTRLHLYTLQDVTTVGTELPCPIKRVSSAHLNPNWGRPNLFRFK